MTPVAGPRAARRKDGPRRALRDFVRRHFPPALAWYRAARTEVHGVQARFSRRHCSHYIGVTGSCGKSTTVNLVAALLGQQGRTEAVVQRNMRQAAFRRLARVSGPIDYMVQEISGHVPGAIADVCRVVRPNIAVVTAVGQDHYASFKHALVEGPGDQSVSERFLAAIAAEKGSLVAALPASGVACLNADDPLVRAMAARAPGRVILYGTSPDADLRAENVTAHWPARMSFDLVIGDARHHVETCFVGTLMLGAVLAALSVVVAVGADLGRAVAALATIRPLAKRMSVRSGTDGHTYIIDTVKAPLWQVQLLLEDLPRLGGKTPIVFVLGEISDSRNDKSTQYRKLLRRASATAAHVIGFGPAASSAHKVRAGGTDNVVGLETYAEVNAYLAALPPSLVILKSNKLTRMSRIWSAVAPPAIQPAAQ
jgi:UDP-N-acetylmuramoyl-tripeptide--D-alanyl-D-alanine ligase